MSALIAVAPFAGAWIEIADGRAIPAHAEVAPFAGAWIEIQMISTPAAVDQVAPFAGAWIEILDVYEYIGAAESRSLCGSVD